MYVFESKAFYNNISFSVIMDKKLNVSNILSLLRLIFAPIIMFMIIFDKIYFAVILFITAALSDLFDGYLAKKLKKETKLGSTLDKIADKVLMALVLAGILIKYGMFGWLFVLAFIALLYTIFGIEFFKKNYKPILFGRILISLQTIIIVLFLLDLAYKWYILLLGILLTAILGFVYLYRLLKEIVYKK